MHKIIPNGDLKLPILEEPEWLQRVGVDNTPPAEFCVQDILRDSFFYPCCRFDGEPVRFFSHYFKSYIFTDYEVSENKLLENLEVKSFSGYRLILNQSLGVEAFFLKENTYGYLNDDELARYLQKSSSYGLTNEKNKMERFFCKWLIFERLDHLNAFHGAKRFSLLYLNEEGVKAFNYLYVANNLKPRALALIQPGYGFGGNWTDFFDQNGALARSALKNKAGTPKYLIWGSSGKLWDRTQRWDAYGEYLGEYNNKSIGRVLVWGNQK